MANFQFSSCVVAKSVFTTNLMLHIYIKQFKATCKRAQQLSTMLGVVTNNVASVCTGRKV